MQLPDRMPDGCNFYGLLQTESPPASVAARFAAAGWAVRHSGDLEEELEIGWGRLTLTGGRPLVLRGWLESPGDRVGEVLGLLGGLGGAFQWVNADGQLWRELPFDESMLDADDPRLPADIKDSIRASRARRRGTS